MNYRTNNSINSAVINELIKHSDFLRYRIIDMKADAEFKSDAGYNNLVKAITCMEKCFFHLDAARVDELNEKG